jgi:hypothetical protein
LKSRNGESVVEKTALMGKEPAPAPRALTAEEKKEIQKKEIKQEGVSLYEKYKQDPIGTYEVLTGVQPTYNRETNIITIKVKEKDEDNPAEYIQYKMNNSAERNRFYKRLLEETDNAKGTAEYARLLRTSFEDAFMKDTTKKTSSKTVEGDAEVEKKDETKAPGDVLFKNNTEQKNG